MTVAPSARIKSSCGARYETFTFISAPSAAVTVAYAANDRSVDLGYTAVGGDERKTFVRRRYRVEHRIRQAVAFLADFDIYLVDGKAQTDLARASAEHRR